MVDITTRSAKGSALSHTEVDGNFTNLKNAVEGINAVTVYATVSNLPLSNLTSGDLAYVSGTNRLYLSNGTGWYNIALVNQTPTITGNSATYDLALDGTATTVTLTGTDPEGIPLTWSATTSGDTNVATVTNSGNVFTITPTTNTSNAGTITVTFSASDGVNIGTASSAFSLTFVSGLWSNVSMSLATGATDGDDNATFIDRSSNSASVSTVGSPEQTAFHPYLDNWSMLCEAAGTSSGGGLDFGNDASLALGTGDFTIEYWANFTSNAGPPLDWRLAQNNGNYPLASYTGSQFTWSVNGTAQITSSAQDTYVWHHVAIVRNSGTTTMYVNGTSEGTWSDSTNYLIGSARVGLNAFSSGADLDGYISNVRVVKGTAVYTSAFTPPTEKLTAISGTILLTCQDNRFKDNSSNDWTPTVTNTPKISPFNPFGQGSEYDVGENKGSLYKPATTNWNISALSSNLDLSGDFTIEMWWYPNTTTQPTNQYIMDFGSSPRLSIWWSWNDSRSIDYAFWAYTNTYQTFSSSANQIYPTNAWTHLAFVRTTSDNTVRLYANGVFQGATQVVFAGDPTGDTFNLGNANGGNSTIPSYWSDVKITPSAKYSSNFTPPTSPLGNTNAGLYFPFDNAGIFDKTGNTSAIVPTEAAGGSPTLSTAVKKYESASINFGTTSDDKLFQINGCPPLGDGLFTIEGWIYPTSATGTWQSILTRDYGSTGGWRLYKTATTAGFTWYRDSTSTYSTGACLTNNTWHHFAVCRDSSDNLRIFIDGTQQGTTVSNTYNYTAADPDNPLNIGSGGLGDASAYPFAGYLEGVQVLVGVAKYTANFTAPTGVQGRTYQEES